MAVQTPKEDVEERLQHYVKFVEETAKTRTTYELFLEFYGWIWSPKSDWPFARVFQSGFPFFPMLALAHNLLSDSEFLREEVRRLNRLDPYMTSSPAQEHRVGTQISVEVLERYRAKCDEFYDHLSTSDPDVDYRGWIRSKFLVLSQMAELMWHRRLGHHAMLLSDAVSIPHYHNNRVCVLGTICIPELPSMTMADAWRTIDNLKIRGQLYWEYKGPKIAQTASPNAILTPPTASDLSSDDPK